MEHGRALFFGVALHLYGRSHSSNFSLAKLEIPNGCVEQPYVWLFIAFELGNGNNLAIFGIFRCTYVDVKMTKIIIYGWHFGLSDTLIPMSITRSIKHGILFLWQETMSTSSFCAAFYSSHVHLISKLGIAWSCCAF